MTSLRTTDDSKFSLLTHPSTDCGWYQDFPLHAKSLHGMKKKYCAQYDCSETLLLGAKLTVKINTDSATLSKEEFFQVKQKKRSNNIILSVVAKNGIIESILRIEAIWTRSVENCNLRHRYEFYGCVCPAQKVKNLISLSYSQMDRSKLDPETLNENALKTPNLDDHQLEADKKQVESNEGIEEIKRDEQAVEADVKSTLNEVIETVGELTVTCSGQCSDCDDEKLTAARVRSMNKDYVIVPMCEVSSDGRGQLLNRNKATKQYNDTKPNGILAHICLELASGMDMQNYYYVKCSQSPDDDIRQKRHSCMTICVPTGDSRSDHNDFEHLPDHPEDEFDPAGKLEVEEVLDMEECENKSLKSEDLDMIFPVDQLQPNQNPHRMASLTPLEVFWEGNSRAFRVLQYPQEIRQFIELILLSSDHCVLETKHYWSTQPDMENLDELFQSFVAKVEFPSKLEKLRMPLPFNEYSSFVCLKVQMQLLQRRMRDLKRFSYYHDQTMRKMLKNAPCWIVFNLALIYYCKYAKYHLAMDVNTFEMFDQFENWFQNSTIPFEMRVAFCFIDPISIWHVLEMKAEIYLLKKCPGDALEIYKNLDMLEDVTNICKLFSLEHIGLPIIEERHSTFPSSFTTYLLGIMQNDDDLLFNACSMHPRKFVLPQLARIKKLYADGQFSLCLKRLRSIFDEDPIMHEAWFLFGMCFYHLKNYSAAANAFRRSLEIKLSENGWTYLEDSIVKISDEASLNLFKRSKCELNIEIFLDQIIVHFFRNGKFESVVGIFRKIAHHHESIGRTVQSVMIRLLEVICRERNNEIYVNLRLQLQDVLENLQVDFCHNENFWNLCAQLVDPRINNCIKNVKQWELFLKCSNYEIICIKRKQTNPRRLRLLNWKRFYYLKAKIMYKKINRSINRNMAGT
ncbi:Tetratricopeptide repeat protein 27 [Trichinella nelsoni]|uniref:Tetratricopeptide repeat protein 27 n=1 Tax=Trichinella nelsoni TaxID=6336 RepID=A0A0V0RXI3_9BILA|nr:Tetratricopeptide repeat protein 27 [Trichinella nelsoni]